MKQVVNKLAYNRDYETGQRYCQYAFCPNHLHTKHFAQMTALEQFVFCTPQCQILFYQLNQHLIDNYKPVFLYK